MKKLLFLIAITLPVLSFVLYQTATKYRIGDHTVTIKGTSNLHDWESAVTKMTGSAAITITTDGAVDIESCQVSIPVAGIKSQKGSIMDKKTWKALNEDQYATIDYQLTKVTKTSKTKTGFTATTTGKLRVAGVSKTISLDITGTQTTNGSWRITGSKALKMTDFGIDPPTALLGTMKTGDDVTVAFSVMLKP